MIFAEPSPGAASGIGLFVVLALAVSASIGFGIGMSLAKGSARIPVGTLFALLAVGACAYALWWGGLFS